MTIDLDLYYVKNTFQKKLYIDIYERYIHFDPKGMYLEDIMKNEGRFNKEKVSKAESMSGEQEFSLFDKNGLDYNESLMIMPSGDKQLISFEFNNKVPDYLKYEELLTNERFIYGRIYDSDFSKWQNETSIDNYKYWRKSYDHLPIIKDSNTGEKIIDISKNPGSKLKINDNVFIYPSWIMFFGESFFKEISKDKLLSYAEAKVNKEIFPNTIMIQLFDKVGESNDNLEKLWNFRRFINPNIPDYNSITGKKKFGFW